MKKLLAVLLTVFLLTGLVGCDKADEVSALIQIVSANKDINEMHIEYSIESDYEIDEDATAGIDVDMDLGINLSIDMSRGITHTVSSFDFFGITVFVEQYSLIMDGQEVTYTNVLDEWTKETREIEESQNFRFDFGQFTSVIQNNTFEIIDPYVTEEKELKQMKIVMTGAQLQETFGFDVIDREASEEEIQEQLDRDLVFIIGYDADTYLIERIEIDIQDFMEEAPEDVNVNSISMVLEISKHNEIGEIVIPQEALNA